jgi:hypothetical protein
MAGCAPKLQHISAVTTATGIDFDRYSQRGFFFSDDAFTGAYEPIGLIHVTSYAAANWKTGKGYEAGMWAYEGVPIQETVDSAYAVAVRLGANALVKMEMRAVERTGTPPVPGVEISGWAIRRKL